MYERWLNWHLRVLPPHKPVLLIQLMMMMFSDLRVLTILTNNRCKKNNNKQTNKLCYNFLSSSFASLLRVLPSFASSEHVAATSSASGTGTASSSSGCKFSSSPVASNRFRNTNNNNNNASRLNRTHSRSHELLNQTSSPFTSSSAPTRRRKPNLLAAALAPGLSPKSHSVSDLLGDDAAGTCAPSERAKWWTELSTTWSKVGTMWQRVRSNWSRRASTCPKQERYLWPRAMMMVRNRMIAYFAFVFFL